MTQGWKSQRRESIRVQVHGPGPHGGRHTKGGGGSAADSEVIRPLGGVFGAVDAKVSVGLRPAPQRAQITIAASRNDA